MNEQQKRIYLALLSMSSIESVVDTIVNVCGTRILNDDLEHELVMQGYLDEED